MHVQIDTKENGQTGIRRLPLSNERFGQITFYVERKSKPTKIILKNVYRRLFSWAVYTYTFLTKKL